MKLCKWNERARFVIIITDGAAVAYDVPSFGCNSFRPPDEACGEAFKSNLRDLLLTCLCFDKGTITKQRFVQYYVNSVLFLSNNNNYYFERRKRKIKHIVTPII